MEVVPRRVYAPAPRDFNYRRLPANLATAIRTIGTLARVGNQARKIYKATRGSSKSVKKGPKGTVYSDGAGPGRKIRGKKPKKKSRRKKTLKSRISALEKNKTPDTTLEYRRIVPYKVNVSTVNTVRVSQFNGIRHDLIEAGIDNIDGVNYTTKNTNVLIRNGYQKFTIKNARTANCEIAIAVFKCIDDDDEGPIQVALDHLADRGIPGPSIPTYVAEVASTATDANIPGHADFAVGQNWQALYCFNKQAMSTKWVQVGKVTNVKLDPGDTFVFTVPYPRMKYRPERKKNEDFNYLANYDYKIVMRTRGDLSHDATNHNRVGYSLQGLDIMKELKFQAVVQNGLGLKLYEISDANTNTGFTVPNHVDNKASAVEADNE